jgi:hypothetical protein
MPPLRRRRIWQLYAPFLALLGFNELARLPDEERNECDPGKPLAAVSGGYRRPVRETGSQKSLDKRAWVCAECGSTNQEGAPIMKPFPLTFLLLLAGARVITPEVAEAQAPNVVVASDDVNAPTAMAVAVHPADAPEALEVIFSNLGPRDDPYNTEGQWVAVAGKSSSTDTEQWQAVRFSPKVDVQAKVLAVALQHASGTNLAQIGLYDNDDILNTVGTLLPGGQGSTSDIPEFDDCCQLAKVTLDGAGVTLFAGKLYWLVVSPDNTNGASFTGRWRLSKLALSAGMAPPLPWGNQPGQWPAAEIRGTTLQLAGPGKTEKLSDVISSGANAAGNNLTIFTNLDRTGAILYLYGIGSVVTGSEAPSGQEVQQALPFTPGRDVHAKTLAAAIGWTSGTKKINLGIYSDSAGTVGTLLPGGQSSTTDIPTTGICCELAKVRLPGAGVALAAGVQYWLVASPDEEQAPDFEGEWQHSNLAVRAYKQPEFFIGWTDVSGEWLAAEIRGTNP